MTASTYCPNGGSCVVGFHVNTAVTLMRQQDGRCLGCGRPPRERPVWTAQDDARMALERSQTEVLVDAEAKLTQKILRALEAGGGLDDEAIGLRTQRVMVRVELARRRATA